jgi:hypothetical protein
MVKHGELLRDAQCAMHSSGENDRGPRSLRLNFRLKGAEQHLEERRSPIF